MHKSVVCIIRFIYTVYAEEVIHRLSNYSARVVKSVDNNS